METNIKVSIQLAGYHNIEQLKAMIDGILKQETDFLYEINIIKNNFVFDIGMIVNNISKTISVHIINSSVSDPFGIYQARGKYLAFCCEGDVWIHPNKLKKQVEFLEQNEEFESCVHDIDLINDQGLSYGYCEQQKYKTYRYSPNKIYSWKELQKNVYPGCISTLLCRNNLIHITPNDCNDVFNIHPDLFLFVLISLAGPCYNFYNQQMVKKQCPSSILTLPRYPAMDMEQIEKHKAVQLTVSKIASKYFNEHFDNGYENTVLAICFFHYYISEGSSIKNLEYLLKLYDNAYQPEFNDVDIKESALLEKKQIFNSLKYEITRYLIKKGTTRELDLFKYTVPHNDDIRIEYILKCYSRPSAINLTWARKLLKESDNVITVKHTVYKRVITAPFRKLLRVFIRGGKFVHKKFKRIVTYRLRKRGYSSYMANEWYDTVRTDLLGNNTVSLPHKLWCYKRGFMPWRLPQYGVTKENFREFLSDRDYMYLHQINNSYKKWIEDKMTFRYVLEPYKKYLPEYYFQIIRREGYPIILPLMDCPQGYEATFDDLLRLLRTKEKLALKAASGTHGIGFYKLSYENGQYYLNNKLSSEYEIIKTIKNFKSFYIVTEYINMHDSFKKIYDGSVNTIRVMMINRDGYHPRLLDAYMRIGSSKSGVTDNIAFGGVTCRVDINTGKYTNGEQLANHKYIPCTYHPDTHTLIEGYVPNWEKIKDELIDLCKYIGQLEYLGFDIVPTQNSFCILEINSHQDLQKFPLYDAQIKKFLFDKLERKYRFNHIKHI